MSVKNHDWQELLRCPACKGELTESVEGWVCSRCKTSYPAESGVIDLIPKNLHQSIARSIESWSAIGWDYNAKIAEMSRRHLHAIDQPLINLYKSGMSVLDIGCGTARLRSQIEAQGAEYVGLDPSKKLLDAAGGGNLIRAVGEYLPFAEKRFDLIIGGYCSFRYIDFDKLLPESRRVLKNGGLMAYTLWNGWALYVIQWIDWMKSVFHGKTPYRPLLQQVGSHDVVNPWGEMRLLQKHGFRVLSLLSTRKFPYLGKWFSWDSYWKGPLGALLGYDLIFIAQLENSLDMYNKSEESDES